MKNHNLVYYTTSFYSKTTDTDKTTQNHTLNQLISKLFKEFESHRPDR